MSSKDLPKRLAACFARQQGLITRPQALAYGVTAHTIIGRLRRGEWVEVQPCLYRCASAPSTWESDVLAATLSPAAAARRVKGSERAPRLCVASFATAANLLNLERGAKRHPLEVSVRGWSSPKLREVTVHRTRTLEPADVDRRRGIAHTNGTRTVLDLSRRFNRTGRYALVDDSVCAGITTREGLFERASALLPGRPWLRDIVSVTEPGAEGTFWSWLERHASTVIAAGGLPQPRWNVPLYDAEGLIGIVDTFWDWAGLPAEFEGLRFHTTPEQRRKDARRYNRLRNSGRAPLRFTWHDVVERPDDMVAQIGAALQAAARRRGTSSAS